MMHNTPDYTSRFVRAGGSSLVGTIADDTIKSHEVKIAPHTHAVALDVTGGSIKTLQQNGTIDVLTRPSSSSSAGETSSNIIGYRDTLLEETKAYCEEYVVDSTVMGRFCKAATYKNLVNSALSGTRRGDGSYVSKKYIFCTNEDFEYRWKQGNTEATRDCSFSKFETSNILYDPKTKLLQLLSEGSYNEYTNATISSSKFNVLYIEDSSKNLNTLLEGAKAYCEEYVVDSTVMGRFCKAATYKNLVNSALSGTRRVDGSYISKKHIFCTNEDFEYRWKQGNTEATRDCSLITYQYTSSYNILYDPQTKLFQLVPGGSYDQYTNSVISSSVLSARLDVPDDENLSTSTSAESTAIPKVVPANAILNNGQVSGTVMESEELTGKYAGATETAPKHIYARYLIRAKN